MIIKSLSRKTASFAQLVDYMNQGALNDGFTINCWADGSNPEAVVEEFRQNAQHLDTRSNGNYLYHEIIALPKKVVIPASEQIKILRNLVAQYIRLRAPENLVYGQIHTDTDYIHAHLMISSNALDSKRRTRLSKADFLEVQRSLENYKLEHYGDLFPEQLFIKPSKEAIKHREFEFKKRTQYPSRNDQVRNIVGKVLASSGTLNEVKTQLADKGFELYHRGKYYGVKDANSRKFRLKTLGLTEELLVIQRLEKLQERQNYFYRDRSRAAE